MHWEGGLNTDKGIIHEREDVRCCMYVYVCIKVPVSEFAMLRKEYKLLEAPKARKDVVVDKGSLKLPPCVA